jgi:hypothetical protein
MFRTRYLWVSNDLIMSQQKGVFRVNCIDCLDRTNVVEVRLSSRSLFGVSVKLSGLCLVCIRATRSQQTVKLGGVTVPIRCG